MNGHEGNSDVRYFPGRATLPQGGIWIVFLAFVYFASARLSLSLLFEPEGIAAIWPPSGIFLSAILLTRPAIRRYLVPVLFFTDFVAEMLAGTSVSVSAVYALALSGDAVLSAWLLLRFVNAPFAFRRGRDMMGFLLFAIILSNAVAATVAATAAMSSSGATFWKSWIWWATSDGIGNLLITPLILSWASLTLSEVKTWSPKRMIEGTVLFVALFLIDYAIFRYWHGESQFSLLYTYLTLPFLLWASFRFGLRGVSSALIIIAAIAIHFALENFGINSSHGSLETIMLLQLSLAVMAIPMLFLATVLDAQSRVEDGLRESRTTLKQILDTTPQSIFWKDLHGVYRGCNRQFVDSTGLKDPDQIIGKTDYDLPWRENAEAYRADDGEVSQSGQAKLHIIETMQQANGSRLWVDTTKVPLRNSNGVIGGVLGVFQDITQQRIAAQEKAELEKRLQQAQKMEAIGTLAGGIAHDFNNILGVILGYADMAKEDALSGTKYTDHLDKVLTAGNRAKDLVKQILAFSRQAEVKRIPLQLQSLVKEAVKMLRASIPTTIEIQDDIDSRCGLILADPTQVHQILMNLCTNANHAMEEFGGVLKIELRRAEIGDDSPQTQTHLALGQYVELIVSDTGTGISPAIIDKIFDPYFTTKDPGKGTGMGLAIIHGIISGYGGAVSVESEVGQGTTFHVYFPTVEKGEMESLKEVEEAPKGKGRILFIDDEELLAEMGKDMLQRLGYEVTVRKSSIDALTTFQNTPEAFDVVITDQTMPGITGADLSRRILQIRPDIPIILCTGYSTLIDEFSAKSIGIKEFALKPLSKGTIAKLLQKILGDEQS